MLFFTKRRFLPLHYALHVTHYSIRIEESSIHTWWSRVLASRPLLVSLDNFPLCKKHVWGGKILNAPMLLEKSGKITWIFLHLQLSCSYTQREQNDHKLKCFHNCLGCLSTFQNWIANKAGDYADNNLFKQSISGLILHWIRRTII